mgnify:CR=1 FL=1
MRKMVPILGLLVATGCSLPKRHDPNLVRRPAVPFVEEVAPAVGGPLGEELAKVSVRLGLGGARRRAHAVGV